MTNQTTYLTLLPAEGQTTQAQPAVGPPGPNVTDAMIFAFLCLVECANTTSLNANVRANGLAANAKAQEKLNAQDAKLQFTAVPKEIIDHHKVRIPHHHQVKRYTWTTYTTEHITTIKNSAIINQKEDHNQEIFIQRQAISQRITVLQQSAETTESLISVITNNAAATDSQATKLLNVDEQLTYAAALTQPARG